MPRRARIHDDIYREHAQDFPYPATVGAEDDISREADVRFRFTGQSCLSELLEHRPAWTDRLERQADALPGLVPDRRMQHAGQVAHAVTPQRVVEIAFAPVPQRERFAQRAVGELPAVAAAGADCQDFESAAARRR